MLAWIRTASTKFQSALALSGVIPLRTLGYSLRALLTAPRDAPILAHAAYVPVADVPGLPRILLLGDAISVGYTMAVRRMLRGIANVHRPPEDCRDSAYAVQQLDAWLGEGKWDVIHANFGLQDCVRDGAAQAVPLDEYQSNLETVFTRLNQTGAKLAWANTTPVPGNLLRPDPTGNGPAHVYRESEIEQYNAAAAVVARAHGAAINTLDQCIRPHLQRLQMANDVCFTRTGYSELGREVAGFLRGLLTGR